MNKLEIIQEISNNISIKADFKFACYTEDMFVYDIETSGSYYEITMICIDDMMLNESFKSLLSKKLITYFSFRKWALNHESELADKKTLLMDVKYNFSDIKN